MEDYGVEEAEEIDLMELQVAGQRVCWVGVTRPSGEVYIPGDVHPLGSYKAMQLARVMKVPYVPVSAVYVLFPAEWLRAECLHDPDRLRIIANMVADARGQ